MNLWDTPASFSLTTPPRHTTGEKTFPTASVALRYAANPLGVTEEGKQRIGSDPYVGLVKQDTIALHQAIEGGLHNKARQLLYDNYRALHKFLWLIIGPTFSNYQAEGTGTPNFTDIFTGSVSDDGTTLAVHDIDGKEVGLRPGWTAFADSGLAAMLTDATLIGETDSSIDIHRSLTTSGVALWRENKPYIFPVFHLELDAANYTIPKRCRYHIDTFTSFYSSLKSVYPSITESQGIKSDGSFCVNRNDPDVDTSQFSVSPHCKNTSCQFYTPFDPGLITANALSEFYLGCGTYIRSITPGVADNSNFRIGRDTWPGLLHLIGLRVGHFNLGLYISSKTYNDWGIVKFDTGTVDAGNYKIYRNHEEIQQARRDAELEESDNVGILALMAAAQAQTPDYYAPGYFASDNPAAILHKAMGLRRSQSRGFSSSITNANGDGDAGCQRIVHTRYTSESFTFGVAGTYDNPNGETRLEIMDTPIVINTFEGARTVNAYWTIPQFGHCVVDDPFGYPIKSTAGAPTVISQIVASNIYRAEFQLERVEGYTTGQSGGEPNFWSFDCAGNVVESEASHCIYNPGSTTRRIGDGQRLVTKGDTVNLTHSSFSQTWRGLIVGAHAYSGNPVLGAIAPTEGMAGIPLFIFNNHMKPDYCDVLLEGAAGYEIARAVNDYPGEPIAWDIPYRGAVAPPYGVENALPAATPLPVLKLTDGTDVWNLTSATSIWQLDHASGQIPLYLDHAAIEDAIGTIGAVDAQYRLHIELDTYNTKVSHVVENEVALHTALGVVRDNGWIDTGIEAFGGYRAIYQVWNQEPGTEGAVQISWGIRQKPGSIYIIDTDPEHEDPENDDLLYIGWDSADFELNVENHISDYWQGFVLTSLTGDQGTFGPARITGTTEGVNWKTLDEYETYPPSILEPHGFFLADIPVVPMPLNDFLSRWTADDVGAATVNISLTDAAIKVYRYEIFDELQPGYPMTVATSPLSIIVLQGPPIGEIVLTAQLRSIATLGVDVTHIGGGVYQGTIDATELVKQMILAAEVGEEVYCLAIPGDVTLGSLDVAGIAQSMTSEYTGYPTNVWEFTQIQYRTISLSSLMIQPSATALDAPSGVFCFDHQSATRS